MHNKYSPSAASRWLNCPDSANHSADSKDNEYTDEGTEAHHLAETALRTGGQVDDENVAKYVDECHAIMRRGTLVESFIEERLVSGSIDDFGGTLDFLAVYVQDDQAVAHLADYKHGQGVAVHAEDNKQLLTYCVLVNERYDGQVDLFRITIVQPRCHEVDDVQTVEVTPDEVEAHRQWILGVIGATYRQAGAHCRWCPLAMSCDELRAYTLKCAQAEFDLTDLGQLVEVMEAAPAIKSYLDSIPAELLRHMQAGTTVPGFKATQSLSNRRWRGDADEICQALGVEADSITERKLVTPAQAEKRGVNVSSVTYRQELGIKVVPSKSRGKATDFSVSEFGELNG